MLIFVVCLMPVPLKPGVPVERALTVGMALQAEPVVVASVRGAEAPEEHRVSELERAAVAHAEHPVSLLGKEVAAVPEDSVGVTLVTVVVVFVEEAAANACVPPRLSVREGALEKTAQPLAQVLPDARKGRPETPSHGWVVVEKSLL